MDTMNIALPKPLKDFVHAQVSAGAYSSASEYVRELIRGDQRAKAAAELDASILESLRSAPALPMTTESWEPIQGEVREQSPPASRGLRLVEHLRGKGTIQMTTDEILALTRDDS